MNSIKFASISAALIFLNLQCGMASANEEMTALQERAIESRTFPGIDRGALLSAAVNLLLDSGFVIDEADADSGVVTASKIDIDSKFVRSSDRALQSSGYIGSSKNHAGDKSWSLIETYRASLTVKPVATDTEASKMPSSKTHVPQDYVARVIFERQHLGPDPNFKPEPEKATGLLTMNLNQIAREVSSRHKKGNLEVSSDKGNSDLVPIIYLTDTVKDPALYQRFFSLLSKSVFIEAQNIQ